MVPLLLQQAPSETIYALATEASYLNSLVVNVAYTINGSE
jgi:hypothetical protein